MFQADPFTLDGIAVGNLQIGKPFRELLDRLSALFRLLQFTCQCLVLRDVHGALAPLRPCPPDRSTRAISSSPSISTIDEFLPIA